MTNTTRCTVLLHWLTDWLAAPSCLLFFFLSWHVFTFLCFLRVRMHLRIHVFLCFLVPESYPTDLLGQPCRGWSVRKAVGKFRGNWSGRRLNLLPLAQRSKQVVFCAKTWVLPMELGGSWCYAAFADPFWNQLGLPIHVIPPNLGSQTLRLQGGAAPFTYKVGT